MADTPNRCNPDGLVFSEGYAAAMEETILPDLAARRTESTVQGAGGKPIHVCRWDADAPRGTVLIVHGFTECAAKYAEIVHSLLRNDWSVVAYDQRGHGMSWRPDGLDGVSLTHVDRFDDYVEDMEAVVAQAMTPLPKPWAVFAHSMGGAVTARFLEAHDGVFARAALCAPMIATHSGAACVLTGLVCRVNMLIGRGKKRVFISKPYTGPEDFGTSCATSRERFDWFDALKAATPAYQNNGPTYGWVLEDLKNTRVLLAPGAVERVRTPVRLYTAELDNHVLPEAQERFVSRLPHGERIVVKGAKHEIFRSTDAVFFPWWHDVLSFLDQAR